MPSPYSNGRLIPNMPSKQYAISSVQVGSRLAAHDFLRYPHFIQSLLHTLIL